MDEKKRQEKPIVIEGEWEDLDDGEMKEIIEQEPPEREEGEFVFYDSGKRILMPNRFAKRKRTIAERERDLVDIAELYLRGYSQDHIAEEMSRNRPYTISRTMIWKDIQRIFARWEKSYVSAAHKLKMRELARLDRLEAEYWDAWERSKKDYIEVRRDHIVDKRSGDGGEERGIDTNNAYERTKTVSRKEQRVGDPRYLEGIERCIKQRCLILGIESARNVNVNWRKQAEAHGINPEEVVNELQEQFIAAAMGRGSGTRSLGEG